MLFDKTTDPYIDYANAISRYELRRSSLNADQQRQIEEALNRVAASLNQPKPKFAPIAPAVNAGNSVVKITANCIVRRNSINDTLDIEFVRYPGKEVYEQLRQRGFAKVAARGNNVWWAKFTQDNYEFAVELCKGREETGKSAKIDKAEHADKADEIDPTKLMAAAERAAKNVTIEYSQLSDDLKDKLDKTKLVKFDLPPLPTVEFDPQSLDSQWKRVVDDMQRGHNVFLIGGAGTGKTFLAKTIARDILGRPIYTINCSQWTSPIEIIGGQTMDGAVAGKLIRAWREGAVLLLDEMPKLDPNTAGLFNDALSEAQKANPADAVIEDAFGEKFAKHPMFACIATGNIYPNTESSAYGANNKQDLSLLDRFAGSSYWIAANFEVEKGMLGNDMVWSFCNRLRETVEAARYESQVSMRFMQTCRNNYLTEMHRLGEKREEDADAGQNLKSAIDSYLNTFSAMQADNLRRAIDYSKHIDGYAYRNYDVKKLVVF